MQFVNLNKFSRNSLTQAQREYFLVIVPLSNFVQQQTINKAYFTDKQTDHGIFTSVICAIILVKSELGGHPVSQAVYKDSPANNLALLEAHKYWKKTIINYGNRNYRGYKNYREFAIDYSDMLAWQNGFEDILKLNSPQDQLKALAEREQGNLTYFQQLTKIIKDYGLQEFDYY